MVLEEGEAASSADISGSNEIKVSLSHRLTFPRHVRAFPTRPPTRFRTAGRTRDVDHIDENGEKGYILEVDLEYLESLCMIITRIYH
ncbi:hypothetical protein TNCV_1896341 [Trichonephila clavipes]|nr:hypothetical protein TNCV_1896341 [Trichonephila clavipes]